MTEIDVIRMILGARLAGYQNKHIRYETSNERKYHTDGSLIAILKVRLYDGTLVFHAEYTDITHLGFDGETKHTVELIRTHLYKKGPWTDEFLSVTTVKKTGILGRLRNLLYW